MSRAGVRDAFQGHMYMYTVNSSFGMFNIEFARRIAYYCIVCVKAYTYNTGASLP